jgi:hypothetical protein|tara:strand:- start:5855 stop:6139 length:285 start_codon:yes stop_codon:yes gene_type:complete
MGKEEIRLVVKDFSIEDMDLLVNVDMGYEEEVEIVIYNFVPEDYNIGEKIVGGWETPDYAMVENEDFTPEDWWGEISYIEQVKKVKEEILKRLK